MGDLHSDLHLLGSYFNDRSSMAYESWDCPWCGPVQVLVLARSPSGDRIWARCTKCADPLILTHGAIHPTALPMLEPDGLPDDVARVWREARAGMGSGAFSSCVMQCRKLLFHIAVDHGMQPKDSNGRAPSFAAAADHLERQGVITKRMRPWVDRIKDVGNEANHELTEVTCDQAADVARFTEQLLRLAYEMDAML